MFVSQHVESCTTNCKFAVYDTSHSDHTLLSDSLLAILPHDNRLE